MGALRNRVLIRPASSIEDVSYRHASLITTVSLGDVQRLTAKPEAHGKVRLSCSTASMSAGLPPGGPPAEDRAALGWPEAPLTLVYAGSVGLAQGLDTLIEAVAPLAESGVVVHVVGEGFDRDRLARVVVTRRLNRIRFDDAVPPEAVPTGARGG